MADVKPMTRKARAAATRQRITESAHRLFLEQGYAATTMPAVAAASGVAVQTVYFTFRTKGDLLNAVFEWVVLGPAEVPPLVASSRSTTANPALRRAAVV